MAENIDIEILTGDPTPIDVTLEYVAAPSMDISLTDPTATEIEIEITKGLKGDKGDKGDQGDPGTPGSAPQAYTHEQMSAASTWNVTHSLGFYPNVSVVDSAGSQVVGDVEYVDVNNLIIYFNAAFGGKAYLS